MVLLITWREGDSFRHQTQLLATKLVAVVRHLYHQLAHQYHLDGPDAVAVAEEERHCSAAVRHLTVVLAVQIMMGQILGYKVRNLQLTALVLMEVLEGRPNS